MLRPSTVSPFAAYAKHRSEAKTISGSLSLFICLVHQITRFRICSTKRRNNKGALNF